jgi:hypothetical protein
VGASSEFVIDLDLGTVSMPTWHRLGHIRELLDGITYVRTCFYFSVRKRAGPVPWHVSDASRMSDNGSQHQTHDDKHGNLSSIFHITA